MLLSLPTWVIHLMTVSEWLAAILLLRRYAARIERPALAGFAYAMLPHLFGGLAILGFHQTVFLCLAGGGWRSLRRRGAGQGHTSGGDAGARGHSGSAAVLLLGRGCRSPTAVTQS